MGIDHGGANVPCSIKIQDGANVHTEKMGRNVYILVRLVITIWLMSNDTAHGEFIRKRDQYRIIKQIFLLISGWVS